MEKETFKRNYSNKKKDNLIRDNEKLNVMRDDILNDKLLLDNPPDNVAPPKKKKERKRKRKPIEDNNHNDPEELAFDDAAAVEGENDNEQGGEKKDLNHIPEEMERVYDEYYPSEEYAKNAQNDDYYAKKRTLDEFYNSVNGVEKYAVKRLKTGEKLPFFARKKRGEPLVAINIDKGYYYPRKEDGSIIMPDSKTYLKMPDGSEVYPQDDNNNQLYNVDVDGNQYLAKDLNGLEYYAIKLENGEKIEYLPVDRNNDTIRIELPDGKAKYPMNLTSGNPIYEKDKNGNQIYWKKLGGGEYYGKKTNGAEIYAKYETGDDRYAENEDGNEYVAKDENGLEYYATKYYNEELIEFVPIDPKNNAIRIKLPDGKEKYTMNLTTGEPIYETDQDGNQIYLVDEENKEYYGKNSAENEVYALDKDKKNYIPAKNENGIAIYAKDKIGNEIYPRRYV